MIDSFVRELLDFPKPGINFFDIGPLLEHPEVFKGAINKIAESLQGQEVEAIVALESRGFLVGAPLAYVLGVPLVPVRKKGKLPGETHTAPYTKEYGFDSLEIQKGSLHLGQKCVLVDDIVATGGSLDAAFRLVKQAGAEVLSAACLVQVLACKEECELDFPLVSLLTL